MRVMSDPTQSDFIKPDFVQSDFIQSASAAQASDSRFVKVPVAAWADLNDHLIRSERPSVGRRVIVAATRFAIAFCIGVVVTLAWQPYGDAAREMIANTSPQLGWMASQTAPGAQSNARPATSSSQKAMLAELETVQARMDRIATSQEQSARAVAQLWASQERIAQEITKLREVEQYLLYRMSDKPEAAARPAAGPERKPARRPSTVVGAR
jgi:hypothetical protein